MVRQRQRATYNGAVDVTLTLDDSGRLMLPEAVRKEMHLSPGDTIDLSVDGEEATLRPRRSPSRLEKERGVWVLRTGEPLKETTARAVLEDIRERR